MAFVVRGLIWEPDHMPDGGTLHPISDHDFLRDAWPSMNAALVQPAQECGFDVTVYVAMHANARNRISDTYMDQLHAIAPDVEVWVAPEDVPDSQFDTASAFMFDHLPIFSTYSSQSIIIMTRDDVIYRRGSWEALSSRYDRTKLNIVSTDCLGHLWDGMHVFPALAAPIFANGFGGRWAHNFIETSSYTADQVHYWFSGLYGQPDVCEPAMGYVDRGNESLNIRFPTLEAQDQYGLETAGTGEGGVRCCARAHQELDNMPQLRQCPLL